MKRNYRIAAVGVVFLFAGLNIASASGEITKNRGGINNNDDGITVDFTVLAGGNFVSQKRFVLNEQEVALLRAKLTELMQLIQPKTQFAEVIESIDAFVTSCRNPVLSMFFKPLIMLKRLLHPTRSFVISGGHGYQLCLLKETKFKLRKPMTFWHYSSQGNIPSKTIIIYPFPFGIKIYSGRQIGIMTRFIGIYININRRWPQQSYSFFVGVAQRALGLNFPDARSVSLFPNINNTSMARD